MIRPRPFRASPTTSIPSPTSGGTLVHINLEGTHALLIRRQMSKCLTSLLLKCSTTAINREDLQVFQHKGSYGAYGACATHVSRIGLTVTVDFFGLLCCFRNWLYYLRRSCLISHVHRRSLRRGLWCCRHRYRFSHHHFELRASWKATM